MAGEARVREINRWQGGGWHGRERERRIELGGGEGRATSLSCIEGERRWRITVVAEVGDEDTATTT